MITGFLQISMGMDMAIKKQAQKRNKFIKYTKCNKDMLSAQHI